MSRLFRDDGGRIDPVALALLVLINLIVFANALRHDPSVGYDAWAHLKYLDVVSEGRLPTQDETWEFFSPPLPYALPAALKAATGSSLFTAAKYALLINVLLSIGLTLILLKLCDLVEPGIAIKRGALMTLGILTVYYRTFSFVRGEPYVAFFALLIVYLTLRVSHSRRLSHGRAVALGVAWGLCALSRQWGFFVILASLLFLFGKACRFRELRGPLSRLLFVAGMVAFLVGGWFYILLRIEYGSTTTFNRPGAERFSFANQPASFYRGTGLPELFTSPVKPAFLNQAGPVLYSGIWGDYWGFFVTYGWNRDTGQYIKGRGLPPLADKATRSPSIETNVDSAPAYLGRVNLVSLFPAALMLASVFFVPMGFILRGRRGRDTELPGAWDALLLAFFVTAVSVVGYAWFLIRYPYPTLGDTIKATYLLHVFPLVAVLSGYLLSRVHARSPRVYLCLLLMLGLVWLHNLGTMFTHYPVR